MSEMKEMLGYLIEIRDSVKRMEERMDRIEERMDRIEERMDRIEERMDRIEERMDRIEERMDRIEERMDRIEERMDRIEERMDQMEEYMEQRLREFQEKMSVMEFALETEIQKVYEVALANQSDIKVLMVNQKWPYNDRQTKQQIGKLNERVNVVEDVVQSHSEAIHKLQGAMA